MISNFLSDPPLTLDSQALQYLLTRPGTVPSSSANGPNGTIPGPGAASFGTGRPEHPVENHQPEHHNPRLLASPQSFRSGRSPHVSSDTWGTTPRGHRSTSQLSAHGSIGKRSGTPAAEYLRYTGRDGPYSPTKSSEHVQDGAQAGEDMDFELHEESMSMSDHGFEGMENVRACCDGLHTVGGNPHPHVHHHPHRDEPPPTRSRMRDGHLDARGDPPRPSSPAWSFRSGSTTSHDGGIFSGKLRFGSRRSAKTSNATSASAMEVHSQYQPT